MTKRWILIVCVMVCLASGRQLAAQVATGFPPFSTQSAGPFDTVNLSNLNVHFAIPIVTKAGAGLPFNYLLNYDSSIYYPNTVFGTLSWSRTDNKTGWWGWQTVVEGQTGSYNYSENSYQCWTGNGYPEYYNVFNNFSYTAPDGTKYTFGSLEISDQSYTAQECTGYFPPSADDVSADNNTGFDMDAGVDQNDNLTVWVDTPSRLGITPVLHVAGLPLHSGSFYDTHNNTIRATVSSGTTNFYDTLSSTTPALTVTGSATPSSPLVYSYKAAGSNQEDVTVHYKGYSVATNFGCSGIAEYSGYAYLVDSIDLPNNTSYAFTYEPTPGNSGEVTGRIASVTLPGGGSITYQYSGGSNGITCADGSTATLTRIVTDGEGHSSTTTYAHSESGSAWTTMVTDPQSNVTYYNFQDGYETSRDTSLGSVDTCYNGASYPCNTAISGPITERKVYTKIGSLTSEVDTTYSSTNELLPLTVDKYDWGPTLKSQSIFSYGCTGGFDHPCSITIENGNNTPVGSSTYQYYSNGDLKSVTSGLSGQQQLTRSFTYNSNGTVATSTDPNGTVTTYSYNGAGGCNSAFVTGTSVTVNPGDGQTLTTSAAWDCDAAKMTSFTDANGQTTSYQYNDPFNRLKETDYPDGGKTTISYSPTVRDVTTYGIGSGGSQRTDTTTLDGLGRVIQQIAAGVETDTTYDTIGRVASVSIGGGTAKDTYQYDALGRVTGITHLDGNSVSTSYSGSCATTTDEAGKTNEVCYDALGRITKVIDGLGNETDYAYDALNDLTTVTEGVQTRTYTYDSLGRLRSATTPESGTTTYTYNSNGDLYQRTDARNTMTTYTFDGLHRLTSKSYNDGSTPSANYSYDQSSVTIGSWSSGTLQYPKGRMTEATTTSSGNVQTALAYSYGPMGRVKNFWQCTPYNCGSSMWAMTYNYDLAGDVLSHTDPAGFTITNTINDNQRISQINSTWNDSNHPGMLAKMTYNSWGALATLTNGCAGSGCVQTQETYDYNDRLQPARIQLGTNSTPSADYCLVYNYYQGGTQPSTCAIPAQPGSGDDGTVAGYLYLDNVNTGDSHVTDFTYDALNRLTKADYNDPSNPQNLLLGRQYTYDRYGNITCGPGGSWTCNVFNPQETTNRLINADGNPVGYDAAGDVTSVSTGAGSFTYQWDAEQRLSQATNPSDSWVYNALGEQVADNGASALFDPAGRKVAVWVTGSGGYWYLNGIMRLGGRMIGQYKDGITYMIHENALGSTSMLTGPAGAEKSDFVFFPYGNLWKAGPAYEYHFAGFDFHGGWGFYGTNNRQYHWDLGSWLSPDPAGRAAANTSNPQSWNRYAYVLNNPATLTDPSGLDPCNNDPDCEALEQSLFGSSPEGFAQSNHGSGGGGAYGTTYTLDGTPVPAGIALGALQGGAAVACPNNDCSGLTAAEGPGGSTVFTRQVWMPPSTVSAYDKMGNSTVSRFEPGYWATLTVGMQRGDVPLTPRQAAILSRVAQLAGPPVRDAAIGTAGVSLGVPLAAEAATSAVGDLLFARGTGLLNSGPLANYIRVGWSWAGGATWGLMETKGQEIFRVAIGAAHVFPWYSLWSWHP